MRWRSSWMPVWTETPSTTSSTGWGPSDEDSLEPELILCETASALLTTFKEGKNSAGAWPPSLFSEDM
eukprot:6186398-Pleurochrysis_carterae.AAC.1